jgi:hypothetical protein
MKLTRKQLERLIKESLNLVQEKFGDEYEKIGQGGFAKIYRSKQDPDKVRVLAKNDLSRSLIMSIKEKNKHLPEYSELPEYSDLDSGISAYQTKYYTHLDETTDAFEQYLKVTDPTGYRGINKTVKGSIESGELLSTHFKSKGFDKEIVRATELIEDAVRKSDHDFSWDFHTIKNFARKDNNDGSSTLIFLDPLSPVDQGPAMDFMPPDINIV